MVFVFCFCYVFLRAGISEVFYRKKVLAPSVCEKYPLQENHVCGIPSVLARF